MASLAIVVVCASTALLLAVAQGDVGSIITPQMFDKMLPNRDNEQCAKGFFTYDAFITAANSFPEFGTGGRSADDMKRELAAFFGQTSHETTGGTPGEPDQFDWGYCFKEERTKATSPPYYGRGPIQLTGSPNYDLAGRAPQVNRDLVADPDLVSRDPVVSFKTAIWFWMTPQGNKPSCHDVALGNWTPADDDNAAGRVPGYGVITNIINGAQECRAGPNKDKNADRIGYYERYSGMLGVAPGDNLDCSDQGAFGPA